MDCENVDDKRLLWLLMNGDIDEIKSSITAENVNRTFANGRKPVHYAADYGHSEVIEFLISKGADVNIPDIHGVTPLMCACYENHYSCVKILLEKGASKNQKAPDGKCPVECTESDAIKALFK